MPWITRRIEAGLGAVVALLAAAAPASAQAEPVALLIENFESGLGRWSTNDGQAAAHDGRATLAALYIVGPGAPGKGGAQAGLIEFLPAQRTWASVSLPVDGAGWAANHCDRLSFWLRGDGSQNAVSVVLRSYTGLEARTDTSYVQQVSLADRDWQQVVLLFDDFRTRSGEPLDQNREAVEGIKLLQFVKTGQWPAIRLTVDDLRVENAAYAMLERESPPGPPVELAPDFEKLQGVSRLQIGLCLGSNYEPLLDAEAPSSAIQAAVAALAPSMIRLRLADFYDPKQNATNLVRLGDAINWVRAAGSVPVVCLDQPRLSEAEDPEAAWQEFGTLCTLIAEQHAATEGPRCYEIGDEPMLYARFESIAAATAQYNEIAAQVLLADPEAKVGGLGFASPSEEYLTHFLRNARHLDFVSLHFFGTHNLATHADSLFETAFSGVAADLSGQLSLADVRRLADDLRGDAPEVWITECALNSSRQPSGHARDSRIQTHYGAAWFAALAAAAAASVDNVLWFKAVGHGWGMIDESGGAFPSYYAARLVQRALGRGATLTAAVRSEGWFCVGAAESEARQVLLVRRGAGSEQAVVRPAGLPALAAARLHVLDERAPGVSVYYSWGAPWGYTCPQHPDVVSEAPGKCPECGAWLVADTTEEAVEYACPLCPGSAGPDPGPCATCGCARPARLAGQTEATEFPVTIHGNGVAVVELIPQPAAPPS